MASFTCKDLKKPIVVSSFYRPTDNNLNYSQELCNTVKEIHARFGDHVLWLGGDANLPDIDCFGKSDKTNGHRYPATIYTSSTQIPSITSAANKLGTSRPELTAQEIFSETNNLSFIDTWHE